MTALDVVHDAVGPRLLGAAAPNPFRSSTTLRFAVQKDEHKVSGTTKPSRVNEVDFARAVDEVARVTRELLDALVTVAPQRDSEIEAARARERTAMRFGVAAEGRANREGE